MARRKLEPKYWNVYSAPTQGASHNYIAGFPCADCKIPIWTGVAHATIKGVGYVSDKRGRQLRRTRMLRVCADCVELRHAFYKSQRHWPSVGPIGYDMIDWAAEVVEDALAQGDDE